MGVWKNSLGDMTTKTTYLKNDIQELYNHIKNRYITRNNVWTAF